MKNYLDKLKKVTIGPLTDEEMSKIINEGVDVCRINMAHANHDWVKDFLRIRSVGKLNREPAIMMDVKDLKFAVTQERSN